MTMNTQVQNETRTGITSGILLAGMLALTAAPAYAVDSYVQNSLFAPSESLLRAEARGRVMIYDGLEIAMVDRAMDEQFDRIDNMMFVRIRYPQADGGYEVEDDGCD